MGNAIVNIFGFSPIKSKFTPSFRCTKYNLTPVNQESKVGKAFLEEDVFYNMLDRNNYYFAPKKKVEAKYQETQKQELFESIQMSVTRLPVDMMNDKEKSEFIDLLAKGIYGKANEMIVHLTESETFDNSGLSKKISIILEKISELSNLENLKDEKKNKT